MNREILFKAKRIDWEELPKDQWWVEGDLLHTRYDDIVLISNFEDQLFRCDGNTVCQFTGLHNNTKWGNLTEAEKESFLSDWNYREDRKNKIEDWSGRKIWENDIVSCMKYIDGNFVDYCIEVGYVEMKHGAFGLHRIKKDAYYRPFKDWLEDYEYEVIGNIFDNPELLEVE